MLHLIIDRFVTTLSKKQRLEFAFILELIRKKYGSVDKGNKDRKKIEDNIDTPLEISIPITDSSIRNIYMVDKNSILQNLPRPNASMLEGHSYISIRQCI